MTLSDANGTIVEGVRIIGGDVTDIVAVSTIDNVTVPVVIHATETIFRSPIIQLYEEDTCDTPIDNAYLVYGSPSLLSSTILVVEPTVSNETKLVEVGEMKTGYFCDDLWDTDNGLLNEMQKGFVLTEADNSAEMSALFIEKFMTDVEYPVTVNY